MRYLHKEYVSNWYLPAGQRAEGGHLHERPLRRPCGGGVSLAVLETGKEEPGTGGGMEHDQQKAHIPGRDLPHMGRPPTRVESSGSLRPRSQACTISYSSRHAGRMLGCTASDRREE